MLVATAFNIGNNFASCTFICGAAPVCAWKFVHLKHSSSCSGIFLRTLWDRKWVGFPALHSCLHFFIAQRTPEYLFHLRWVTWQRCAFIGDLYTLCIIREDWCKTCRRSAVKVHTVQTNHANKLSLFLLFKNFKPTRTSRYIFEE